MKTKLIRKVATLPLSAVFVSITTEPVAATHEMVGCETYEGELEPLLMLIHDLTRFLMTAGAALAVLAIAYGGIVFLTGSQDKIREAKRRVKVALLGSVILFSAPLIISYLSSRLLNCGGI
jgi:type IV secretory pathway VirB2 component (pilin)